MPTTPAGCRTPDDGFLRHRGLIALAVGGAAGLACLLSFAAPGARPLAPQMTAIPPLAIFHDLRWLFGSGWTWPGFCAGFAALILGRSAVSTATILLAWPRAQPRPRILATFGRCVVFTLTASVLLSPVVTLLLGVALVPFSWPFLAALPALLLILLPLAHGGLLGSWWRTLPPPRAVGWLIASFAALSAAAAVIAILPTAAAIPAAGLAGLMNARAWYGLAVAVTQREAIRPVPRLGRSLVPGRDGWAAWGAGWGAGWGHAWRWLGERVWPGPLSPVAAAAAIAVVAGATRLIFVLASATPADGGASAVAGAGPAVSAAAPGGPGGSGGPGRAGGLTAAVLVIPGFGSSCCSPSRTLRRIGPPTLVRPFSYRGLAPDGRPLSYGLGDTDLPLWVLGDRIATQVWRLHEETGRLVDIVAESEGTLGVQAMLARHPHVPVSAVALLSPIADGSAPAADPVPGDALDALVRFAGALSPFGPSGAQQLMGSVARQGDASARAAARHERRLRVLVVIPLADALTLPVCDLPGNALVVPALHGSLLGEAMVDRTVRRFFSGERATGPQELRDTAQLIAAAAAAWRMPEVRSLPWSCTQ